MQSAVIKRSIVVHGHKTSVSLEDAFWEGLKEIGLERRISLSQLVAAIDAQRQHGNLSSAIRLFVLDFYRAQLSGAKEAHKRGCDVEIEVRQHEMVEVIVALHVALVGRAERERDLTID